ncbi:MAG: 16S rRNA (cytidine(1402)-2'-O)-methyltransferase [Kiritimatiellae bacterium]|jgi:16S rRNA (cytidine1402-2'-O)-methyltransferase|nr:16S rRNA (cytidine(1402)-2'-O)-methyltransferase [Kiritimatiellia bacterium]
MLYILATPIGNLGDITLRGIEVLKSAKAIACEDTRRTRILLTAFDIPTPQYMISYREGVEKRAGEKIMKFVEEGHDIVLCTDGGYPGISDPGYRLVEMAAEQNIEYVVIPGASAVPVALLMSALPTSSYTFKGFPPKKRGQAIRFFEEEAQHKHTLIIYESPYRVAKTLETALEGMGNRKAAVCIELTKKFERVSRGYLSELFEEYKDLTVKGEVAIVIAGNNSKFIHPDSIKDIIPEKKQMVNKKKQKKNNVAQEAPKEENL